MQQQNELVRWSFSANKINYPQYTASQETSDQTTVFLCIFLEEVKHGEAVASRFYMKLFLQWLEVLQLVHFHRGCCAVQCHQRNSFARVCVFFGNARLLGPGALELLPLSFLSHQKPPIVHSDDIRWCSLSLFFFTVSHIYGGFPTATVDYQRVFVAQCISAFAVRFQAMFVESTMEAAQSIALTKRRERMQAASLWEYDLEKMVVLEMGGPCRIKPTPKYPKSIPRAVSENHPT